MKPYYRAHLDPDLIPGMRPRPQGWRPLFGQCGAAQGHLAKQGVGPGDTFLFFGLFRDVDDDGLFVRGSKPRHILWGWLQVDEVLKVDHHREQLGWAEGHPHLTMIGKAQNTIYTARKHLLDTTVPGAGVCPKYDAARQLTAPGGRCSRWLLPAFFNPKGRRSALSYHGRENAWEASQDGVLLQSVGRGQEFVLDCGDYPEAAQWALNLIRDDQS